MPWPHTAPKCVCVYLCVCIYECVCVALCTCVYSCHHKMHSVFNACNVLHTSLYCAIIVGMYVCDQSVAQFRVDLWHRLPPLCILPLAVSVWSEGAVTSQRWTHNGRSVLILRHRCLLTPVDARQWEGPCGRSCCLVAVCHHMISGSDILPACVYMCSGYIYYVACFSHCWRLYETYFTHVGKFGSVM